MDKPAIATITAFSWVPDFARGQVRDLIVRWAFEELGQDYAVELLNAGVPRSEDYLARQPFDQVPAYRDDEVEMFEAGAILIHLAEKHGQLMPRDAVGKAKVLSWLVAGLNSVEPPVRNAAVTPLFYGDQEWSKGATETYVPFAQKRLSRLAAALGDKEWLADEFSIADILMVYLLHTVGSSLAEDFPSLVAYRERGRARPAFKRALQAQLDDFTADAPNPA